MSKWANTLVLDGLLNVVSGATSLIVTTEQPANRADAVSKALATANLTSSDFSKSAGSPNGRKLTIAQKAVISVTATGNATHVCLVNNSDLLYVTTVTSQPLTAGNTVTVPSWAVTVSNPA